jgi:hypothetical protein
MADATEQFEEELRKLSESTGKQSAAQDDVIKTLMVLKKLEKEEAEQLKKLQTAKEKEFELLRKKEEREQNILSGLIGLGSALKQTILSFTSVTSSVYNTDKAFTAVIPVLDTIANVAKTTVSAFGKMASGSSILGFSIGKLSEGMAELANSGIDVLTGVLKFQLETAQKVADNFVVLSKSGVTFGGSIDRMAKGAANAGLTIDMFTKFMSTNVESLAQMSGGVQNSGAQIAALGREIGQTNRRLLLSYGSYDELNNAIVEYADLQRQVGIDELRDRNSLKKGATDYLIQQKELTALTGKSADQLKKEQEERRKDSAYQIALNKMSANERLNAEYALSQISAKFGPEAAQYAKELITTGEVFSKTGIAFQEMAGPIAGTIKTSVMNLNQTTDAFKQNTNSVIAADAARNAAFAKNSDMELFAQMTQAGYGNDIVKTMSNLAGSILSAEVAATNAVKNRQALENENAKGIGTASQNYVNAVETLIKQQQKIDNIVIGNMDKMANLVQGLYTVNEKFINATGGMNEAINGLMNGSWKDFKAGMDTFTKSLLSLFGIDGGGMRTGTVIIHTPSVTVATEARVATETSSNQANERARQTGDVNDRREAARLQRDADIARRTEETARMQASRAARSAPLDPSTGMPVLPTAGDSSQNLPKKAIGGITSGPTIVGEDGAEAVIPLKGGSIPLKIDFGPLSMAMEKQMNIAERMLDEIRDSKDIQKQILNASY